MVIRCSLNHFRKLNFKNSTSLAVISLISLVSFLYLSSLVHKPKEEVVHVNSTQKNFIRMGERVIIPANASISERNNSCNLYNCFDIYKCGKNGEQQIHIYVYPLKQYLNSEGRPIIHRLSREFYSIVESVSRSKYYTSDPNQACVFLPPFDTLAQDNFLVRETSQALNHSLPYWNNGENHIIFNMLPDKHSSVVELGTGKAMIAGAGFDSWTYRSKFDISLPAFSPYANTPRKWSEIQRTWLVTSSQLNVHSVFLHKINQLSKDHKEMIVLKGCAHANILFRCINDTKYPYPAVLQNSKFCLILRGTRLTQPALLEAMAAGCIPIVVSDTLIMPFREVIDWRRAALFILEDDLNSVIDLTKSISQNRIEEMSAQCVWLYSKYFSSMEAITNTTLDILNQRVFPQNALFYEDWNLRTNLIGARSPLILRTKSYSSGFTAVVLTYDRVESLFLLIERLALVPSLSMILVIWNNQRIAPPEASKWPKISKPLKIKQTKENKLSNRFYPYEEIETEAVLSLDDDISMLTEDELDFGFEVWREFPDRIVGFPSRTHVWSNVSESWRYESEWTNEISMILTGAAFYHKYWNYLYTTSMPGEIKEWVDQHMNCEDIAMNFLVANVTNKAPIKVAPRKKFKCPECTNTEMLSADLHHMVERSKCINKFTEIYGRMPLKKVEFRADPVLYKDSFPAKLKRFKNIGNL
ncbi:exostosin-2 [Planococcus citri]|uniref:exostosin-2 n=1 Tax=Planococcus citri TaxID=170843 RepID=UPI0031F76001